VLLSKSNGDYVPNLTTLAQQKFNSVTAVGFLMADALNTVAGKFPDTSFSIVDFSAAGLKDKPTNVVGLLFAEQEAGYLAGYLAGLWAKDNGAKVISSVGGQKIPPVDHYIAGYQAGAKKANPGIQTLNGYSQDFVDQAKCKEIALDQIAKGSKVVFQVAGGCGLGALDAAKEKGVQGIGVDADQAYLGDHIMTSALKKVDQAVYDEIKAVQDGSFKGGDNTVFDVKSGGVGIGDTNEVGAKYADQVKEVQDKIASGELTDIPDTVK
jgi:basic membrane protein A and related proteins